MQRLKGVYPQYADKVDFYAVGVFPTHDVEVFEEFRVKRGYPWPVAVPQGDLLPDLNVTIQSTKIAFDSEGLVVHRAGMGKGSPEIWHRVFTELSTSQ